MKLKEYNNNDKFLFIAHAATGLLIDVTYVTISFENGRL